MAAVLETLTVPCASALPPASFSRIGASKTLSCFRKSAAAPGVAGLKIQMTRSFGSTSLGRRPVRRGGRIACEAQETAVVVPPVNDSKWQSLVLECDTPVLVEFWAPWCGPCRMIHPIIDELAKEYNGKLKCYKVNTDECPSIATQYGIRSIPTVIIFKAGEKKEAVIGAVPKSTLTTSIEKFL